MNRREAIVAGAVSIAAAVPAVMNAQASQSENPEVEPIRALLKAHDEAFTNQDINGVLSVLHENRRSYGFRTRRNLVRSR